ncbi:crystallin J1 [Candidatus Thorarchaeota archaeon]|nr:MAG: crystallin J1 [Candidatus Thorarchaeota archaeon]
MTMDRKKERLMEALEGLSVGDAFGQNFFDARKIIGGWEAKRELPPGIWRYTDDTITAISIAEILLEYDRVIQDELAMRFAQSFDPARGYGPSMYSTLPRIKRGEDWRVLFGSLFGGEGSFGNGAAMRVAPVGAYFAKDLDLVVENATLSAQVTHQHPEATAGAIAVAVGAAIAYQTRQTPLKPNEFIEELVTHVPEGDVKNGLRQALECNNMETKAVAKLLGAGHRITVQDTVPYVIWCASRYLNDFEEALWQTVSGGGDMDTTCAMVGGIVACHVGGDGIPNKWISKREPLPDI